MVVLEKTFYDAENEYVHLPALEWLRKLGYYGCDYCLISNPLGYITYKIRFFDSADATAFLLLFP